MKRTLLLTIFLILTSLILVSLAFAKGSPDKIIIWGPSLAKPIEINDLETLKTFDPWNGQFLDRSLGAIVEEPQIEQTYYVFFYFRDRDSKFREFYTFQYFSNSANPRGFIYLPGEGEPGRLMNSQTIARANGWYYASEKWDTLIQDRLKNDTVSQNGFVTLRDLQTLVPIIIISGTAMIWLFWRRYPRFVSHKTKSSD